MKIIAEFEDDTEFMYFMEWVSKKNRGEQNE